MIPNKQAGAGYAALLSMENGEALYGAFHAMILYLSKQPNRDGWLTKDGTEKGDRISAASLAGQIRFSKDTVKRMLLAVTNEIGWLIDHSAEQPLESIAYPGRRVDIKFVIMAQKFHATQIKKHPHQDSLQKGNIVKTNLAGARNLETFHLERGWPVEKIEALLAWIPGNSFWCYQIRSLMSTRLPG